MDTTKTDKIKKRFDRSISFVQFVILTGFSLCLAFGNYDGAIIGVIGFAITILIEIRLEMMDLIYELKRANIFHEFTYNLKSYDSKVNKHFYQNPKDLL